MLSHFFGYCQNGCSLYVVPVLHNPVILAPIHTIPHGQHSVVQSCLGADPGVIHPTVVQLKRGGGGKGEGRGREGRKTQQHYNIVEITELGLDTAEGKY